MDTDNLIETNYVNNDNLIESSSDYEFEEDEQSEYNYFDTRKLLMLNTFINGFFLLGIFIVLAVSIPLMKTLSDDMSDMKKDINTMLYITQGMLTNTYELCESDVLRPNNGHNDTCVSN